MSHTDLSSIFAVFKREFPPAETYIEGSTLKLTTSELIKMINDLNPDVDTSVIVELMSKEGYIYLPIEYNEEITFYWLIKKRD